MENVGVTPSAPLALPGAEVMKYPSNAARSTPTALAWGDKSFAFQLEAIQLDSRFLKNIKQTVPADSSSN